MLKTEVMKYPATKGTTKEQIFTDAVRENEKRITNICRYYFGNNPEAQDVSQEVLLKIWLNISSFRGESQLKTWITRIAVNTCLNLIAKKKREFALFVRPDSREIADIIDEEYDEGNHEEMLRFFGDYTLRLNAMDKTLVALYMEDVPYTEIAQVTGFSEVNARTRISRIKAHLQESWRRRNEDK
ncbi:MAG: RNA polymerase sigma factor [Bacteroidales bacterium]|nr:RNA polymerase sigma factor [Bacteroidales bacterium]